MAEYTPDTKEILKAYKAYRAKQDILTWGGWAEGPHPKRYAAEFNRWVKILEKEARQTEAPVEKVRQPRRSKEMKELLTQKQDLQQTIDIEYQLIYTLQQDPYNRDIKNRKVAGIRRRINNLKKKVVAVEELMAQLKY